MDELAEALQAIGYHAALARPLLSTYTLLIFSAIIPIFTGAHASLKRPSSAAKPSKRKKPPDSDNEEDEAETLPKMEGLGPLDAIFLPIFAGMSLGGLYLLIKWLEDPTLLSKLINWYFSLFGIVALAKLGTDGMGIAHDFIFPMMYCFGGQTWQVRPGEWKVVLLPESLKERTTPLPGPLSILPLPRAFKQVLWTLRSLPSNKTHVRAYIRGVMHASVKVGPYAIISALLAVGIQLYSNIIYAPWYLNNLSAFAFVYSTLQILSPTTSWTATLILSALFAYDIYFVFYTPLMVEVATKLDIPAKMLFPRPEGMSMLGLGDLVVPGMVVGFALRFDLWLFYFRQQMSKARNAQNCLEKRSSAKEDTSHQSKAVDEDDTKPQYHSATGFWGTRFWAAGSQLSHGRFNKGTRFSKPYFQATMTGYTFGLICTLFVMQVFGHAQPALLYLVPGVLGALWGTAIIRGEVGVLWRYTEDDEQDGQVGREESRQTDRGGAERKSSQKGWWRHLIGDGQDLKEADKKEDPESSWKGDATPSTRQGENSQTEPSELSKLQQRQQDQIFFFSISYPGSTAEPQPHEEKSAIQDRATMTDSSPL